VSDNLLLIQCILTIDIDLLDQDTEMRHAIEDLDFYGETANRSSEKEAYYICLANS
jgi:hypothetical protein